MSNRNHDPRPLLSSRSQPHQQHASLRHVPLPALPLWPTMSQTKLVLDDKQQPQLVSVPYPLIRERIPTNQNQRDLFGFPRPPWYGTPLTPPSCVFDPLSLECKVPTPTTPVQPSPPHASASMDRREVVVATVVMGIVVVLLVLLCYFLMRPSLARRRTATEPQQPPPADPAQVLSDAERKSEMQANMKLVQTNDIVLGDTNSCSICLSEFVTDDSISGSLNPECQHYFHTECILQAFLQRPKSHDCPVCRRDFFVVEPTSSTSSSSSEPSEANQE
jgi:hypothetical protein